MPNYRRISPGVSLATVLVTVFFLWNCSSSPPPPTNPAPALQSVSAIVGTTAGGSTVTLTGEGFLAGASVKFGSDSCTSVTVNSSTELTCATPSHAPTTIDGVSDVSVTNSDTQSATLASAYTFQAPAIATWTRVSGLNGLNKNAAMPATSVKLGVLNGKLYAIWPEFALPHSLIHVAVYSGDDSSPTWTLIDGNSNNGINFDPTNRDGLTPKLLAFNSKLYAIWREQGGRGFHTTLRVAVYNGNESSPSWSFVDGSSASGMLHETAYYAQTLNVAVFNSKMYLTWSESSPAIGQLRIAVYNGNDGAPAWSFLDGDLATGLNKDTAKPALGGPFVVHNSKLYLGWAEQNASNLYQARVAVYNGNDSSPSWTFVDGNGASGLSHDGTIASGIPTLTSYLGAIYAFWGEGATGQIRAVVYNGNDSSPTWTFVDGNGVTGLNKNTANDAYVNNAIVFNSKIYVTTGETDGTAIQARVLSYKGGTTPVWFYADGNGATGLNQDPAIAASSSYVIEFNNKLYSSYIDGSPALAKVSVGH